MREMRIKTLYKDDNITLQKLTIKIGECHMCKFRQINVDENGDLNVTEVKQPPVWYLRMLKIKQLGL